MIQYELRRLYQDGRLIPFIGAGVSMSVSWDGNKRGLSWEELVAQAAILMGYQQPELLFSRGDLLQVLEYFRIKNDSMAKLTNYMVTKMLAPDDALRNSTIHQELVAMDRCNLYYTTNFDTYLEQSFRLGGRDVHVIATESDLGGNNATCEVVKFHGDLDHPEHMVMTESDYQKRLAFSAPMDRRFWSDLLGRAVLFIGYSFRDPNVSYLFRLISDQLADLPNSPSGRRAYIVVADPSDFEETLFQKRNIEVIPVRRRHLTSDVASVLREIRS